jgi:hypothetical protein
MQHVILNLSDGDRAQAVASLNAQLWALDRDERHGSVLAPGDLVLIHVGRPRCEFIGCARQATGLHDWTPQQSQACPDGRPGGVVLADIEVWSRGVPLANAVALIDPAASNPYVQANAAGFRTGVVLITAGEYAAVLALSRAARQP